MVAGTCSSARASRIVFSVLESMRVYRLERRRELCAPTPALRAYPVQHGVRGESRPKGAGLPPRAGTGAKDGDSVMNQPCAKRGQRSKSLRPRSVDRQHYRWWRKPRRAPQAFSFLFHRARRILFSLARQRKENGGCIPRPRPEAGKLLSPPRGRKCSVPRPRPEKLPSRPRGSEKLPAPQEGQKKSPRSGWSGGPSQGGITSAL